MAGRNSATPAPRCTAKLKDGSECRTYAEKGETLCAFHLRQEQEEAPAIEPEPEVPEEPAEAPEPTSQKPKRRVENVRAELAKDSQDAYEVIKGSLLDALGAEKDSYVACPHCRKKHPVSFPDWTARTNAIKTLLEQGFGRPQENRAGFTLKDPAAIREAVATLYQQLDLKPVTEMDSFELELACVGGYLEDVDLAEQERELQKLISHLTNRAYAAQVGLEKAMPGELGRLAPGVREKWRRVARYLLAALGESEKELTERFPTEEYKSRLPTSARFGTSSED